VEYHVNYNRVCIKTVDARGIGEVNLISAGPFFVPTVYVIEKNPPKIV
jgi:hypothetical protein